MKATKTVVTMLGLAAAFLDVSAKDWYVDANFGHDDWDGSCKYEDRDETNLKGPKKTLVGAMGIITLADEDVVHAASGVYNERATWHGEVSNRVVIAKNIGLVADEGRDVTFIDGVVSTQYAGGNGDDAVRCVKFTADKGAYVKGFTIRNGRTQTKDTADWNHGGGCVCGAGVGAVVDCIVTNGNASFRGAISGVSGVTMIGCRIYAVEEKNARNEQYTTYGKIDFVNCVVDGSVNGSSTGGVAINSVFTGDGPNSGEGAWNCIIWSRPIGGGSGAIKTAYYNCLYVSDGAADPAFSTDYPSTKVTRNELALDAGTWRPARNSVAVDAGIDALYTETVKAKIPEAFWPFTGVDLGGKARICGAAIDVGAYEYGNRTEDVVAALTDHPAFAVTDMTGNTSAAKAGGVVVPAGGSFAASWTLSSGEVTSNVFTFTASVEPGATLKVYLDGADEPTWTVVASEGERTISYRAGQHALRFVSEGGTATVKSVTADVRTAYFVKPTGDDTADGRTFATARRTLKGAMGIEGLASGDVVYVAPGVYAEGEMWDGVCSNRVIIAEGVGLIGYAGPAETVIEGKWANTADHTGPDAVRCAHLCEDAFAVGFTLRNGATASETDQIVNYLSGGNVWAEYRATLVDCIVTNGVAKFRGGGASSYYFPGGNYIRCCFADNRGIDSVNGIYHGNCFGCVFRSGQSLYGNSMVVCNCVFTDYADISGNGTAISHVYNSIFDKSIGARNRFHRCLLGPSEIRAGLDLEIDDGTLIGQKDLMTKLDANYRPLKDTNLVDFGDANHYLTNFPAAFARFADKDFAGGQRVYNGAIDAGPGEYDWRGDFAAALAKKGLSVDVADADVTTNALAGVDIAAGATLTFRVTLKAAGACSFSLAGEGTPVVKLGATELIGSGGTYSFEGEAGKAYDVTVFVTSGVTTLSSVMLPKSGALLILR